MRKRNLFAVISSCFAAAALTAAFFAFGNVGADNTGTTAVSGDANSDGIVNVRDCAFIASKLACSKADEIPQNADYNNDGQINVRDAAAIAKYLASGITIDVTEPTEPAPVVTTTEDPEVTETSITDITDITETDISTDITETTVTTVGTTAVTTTTPVTTETEPVTTEHVHNYVAVYVEEPIYEKHWIDDLSGYDMTVMYHEYVRENGEISFFDWQMGVFDIFVYETFGQWSTGDHEEWVQVGTETIFKWGECECGAYTTVEEICTKPDP